MPDRVVVMPEAEVDLEGACEWYESRELGTSLELPTGGFRGASWDQQADVEYSFYGLGILGLLYDR